MRTRYHEQLAAQTARLGELSRLAGVAMERATRALLQADRGLAEQVLSDQENMTGLSAEAEKAALALLALQQPVAGDLRVIVSGLQIVAHVDRMAGLAMHVAKIARRRHPMPALPEEVHGYFAEMGRLAVDSSNGARDAVLSRDSHQAVRIADDDNTIDDIRRDLLKMLLDPEWTHGTTAAVDVTLLGRFYERFADHAVEVAGLVSFQVTGKRPAAQA
jgi:phosphate transport system protein